MQLNLNTLVLAFALISTAISMPNPSPKAALQAMRSLANLTPRDDCDLSDPCTALLGAISGVYCGYCPEVLTQWKDTDVYQLDGTTGECCKYGPSNPCKAGLATMDTSLCPRPVQ